MAIESELQKEIDAAIDVVVTKPSDSDTTLGTVSPPESTKHEGDKTPVESVSADVETPVESVVTGDSVVDDKPEVAAPEKIHPSDAAVERAIRAGLTYADAKSFTNDEALNRIAASIEAAKRPTVSEEREAVQADDPLADLPKLDPEVYEEGVIKMYDSLVAVVKKQQDKINQLSSGQQQVMQSRKQQAANETEKWFDDRVADLGEEFHETLGKGSYRTLDQSSSQYAKRDAIANQAAVLLAGYRAAGVAVPHRDEVFSQAARLVLGSDFEKAHERKLTKELSQRSTQHLARVGAKNAKTKGDPLADVAAILDSKYFGKT